MLLKGLEEGGFTTVLRKELAAPEVSEHYREIEEVGNGSFGQVFKGYRAGEPGKLCALKRILLRHQDEGLHVSAYREIIALRRLKHEGLLELRDVACRRGGPGRGAVVLVFDYYEHDLLGLVFMRVQLSLPQLKTIFQKLVRAVAYLHSRRVIHRDIKSANVLLSNKGEVRLADLGLALSLPSGVFSAQHPVCTLLYQSPEQLLHLPSGYGFKADIWGLGCILAELLTGEPLFLAAQGHG